MLLLGVLTLITKSFAINAILHIYLRLLIVPILIKVLHSSFKGQLTDSMHKALALCGSIIALDIVILDAVRYILSGGIATVLFLPVCLPACFMVLMFYSAKDTGRDKKQEIRWAYIIGVPLLLLSLYFEILSFVQM